MSSQATHASSALLWPVPSPWALRRRGNATAWLSTRQRTLLFYVKATMKRGPRTLDDMARAVGVTSRGQIHRELRRLRQLELISFRGRLGCKGNTYLWPRLTTARRPARPWVNDSASTPFGRFISRKGVEAVLSKGGSPLLAGRAAARDGPRRGTGPPRTLNARCPVGHPTRIGRRSWTRHARGLVAEWSGECRICRRAVLERVEIAYPEPAARDLSPDELADPSLLDRRRRIAALFEADGIRSTMVRQYRELGDRSDVDAGRRQ